MTKSLEVPTATSVRTIPVKLLDENRQIINKHLLNVKKKKVSFTHILAWAIVKALVKFPQMNSHFDVIDGKPAKIKKKHINLGLAIDLERKDGSRLLLVPNIKNAEGLTFSQFVEQYDLLIEKARNNRLDLTDLEATTVTLTNPGMIGTTHSSPRLMKGQGLIVATGSIDYPTEFQAVNPAILTDMAISKVVTITSTYDHRIIQGAESAEFLAYISNLLLGKNNFYYQIFYSLDVPFEPLHWQTDIENKKAYPLNFEDKIEKNAHIMLMINAYRVRGHLLASSNPLGRAVYYYPELDPAYYGLTIWDLDRYFHADDSWERNELTFREIFEILRSTYCGHIGYEFMHIQAPDKKEWIKTKLETKSLKPKISNEKKVEILHKLIDAEFFENYLHTKFIGHKRFSLEGGETLIVLLSQLFEKAAEHQLHSIVIGMAHRGRLNVLVNNVGKKPELIFNEFEGDYAPELDQAAGDVKYHLGDKGKYTGKNGHTVEILLSPNPSHLELVNPVIA
ncbi:MAG TPA: 2-oxo acid dehydrogenase subunit E2, partial [Candidatus Kapabacteria bacterium]|nr:2-oxo acid dehydrogenase subunit E2 [Candidatus Kapabacteria bacterium]